MTFEAGCTVFDLWEPREEYTSSKLPIWTGECKQVPHQQACAIFSSWMLAYCLMKWDELCWYHNYLRWYQDIVHRGPSVNRVIQAFLEKKYCKNYPPGGDQTGSQLAEKLSHPSPSVQSKIAALYGCNPLYVYVSITTPQDAHKRLLLQVYHLGCQLWVKNRKGSKIKLQKKHVTIMILYMKTRAVPNQS